MSLFSGSAKNVSAISKDVFQVSPDRLKDLEERVPELYALEYWNPVYQAWKPFLDTYFKCGVNAPLTVQWGSALMQKEDYILPPDSVLSPIFAEIQKLRNTTGTILFENYLYGDIEQLCANEITFFLQNRKTIAQQLHNAQLYTATIQQLLDEKTWRGFLCAIYLYRHCQAVDMKWPSAILQEMNQRLEQWVTTYLETFDFVFKFIDGNSMYDWYDPAIRNVVQRVWTSALIIEGRPRLLSPSDIGNLSPVAKDAVISYVGSCPVVYDDPFHQKTVWASLCNLFFAGPEANEPNFVERVFYAMCIPDTYIGKLCDVLFDFYWLVKDGNLTGALYDRKITAFSKGEGTDMTPEMYLKTLYLRGYPTRKV